MAASFTTPSSSSSFLLSLLFLLISASSAANLFSEGGAQDSNLGFRSEAAQERFAEYDVEDYDAEDGEERFLFSSTTSVTVNSTLLRAIGAIIGALLIAIPLYLAYATATSGGGGGGGGSTGGYGGSYRSRFRRDEDEDLASHMYVLLDSFRKFEDAAVVSEEGCQILVACEAGKMQHKKHPKYGNLTTRIHKILSTVALASRRQLESKTEASTYVDKLLSAHEEGQKRGSDCQSLYKAICPKKSSSK